MWGRSLLALVKEHDGLPLGDTAVSRWGTRMQDENSARLSGLKTIVSLWSEISCGDSASLLPDKETAEQSTYTVTS